MGSCDPFWPHYLVPRRIQDLKLWPNAEFVRCASMSAYVYHVLASVGLDKIVHMAFGVMRYVAPQSLKFYEISAEATTTELGHLTLAGFLGI